MWSTSKPQYDVISKHHYDYGVLEGPLERVVESDPVNETISKPTPVLADNREDNQISRPNILLVVADDLRPQLGLYGGRAQTPHLDELAASPGSMIFERAYAQITVNTSSHSRLLSAYINICMRYLSVGDSGMQSESRIFPEWTETRPYSNIWL